MLTTASGPTRRGPLTASDFWGRATPTVDRLASYLAARTAWADGWRWRLLRRFWPLFAMLVAVDYEALLAENTLFWVYTACEDDFDSLLDDIGEQICRAPAPLGADEYFIRTEQLTAVPNEMADMPIEWLEATLPQRKRIASKVVSGDRWYDWKHGQGRQELRAMLALMKPSTEFPVTLIRIVVTGQVIARREKGKLV